MMVSDTPPLSMEERHALATLAGQIIPASDTFDQPGADDPVILDDIIQTGSKLPGGLSAVVRALMRNTVVDAASAAMFQQNFPDEATVFQTVTVQCYYRDPRVMSALKIDNRPPFPKGYIQEPNDFALLEPVRKRGEVFRKVPSSG